MHQPVRYSGWSGARAMTSKARTVDGWFEIQSLGPGIRAFTEWLGDRAGRFGPIFTHAYLVEGEDRAALIDAGLGIGNLRVATAEATGLPVQAILTHSHYDHVGSAHLFDDVAIAEGGEKALAAELSAEMQAFADLIPGRCTRTIPTGFSWDSYRIEPTVATTVLQDGDEVDLGGRRLRVFHTPGHSPGSACFLDSRTGSLFTGDTVFGGGLNIQLEQSDPVIYEASMARLADLVPDISAVFPAHLETPLDPTIIQDIYSGIRSVLDGNAPMTPSGDWAEASFERFSLMVRAGVEINGGDS